ncbi:hypothetical protein CDAR_455181 [Caerostris darwini]|uniref:Uncharacterized protein n=1 Tax=Caerostris darwini TaxID=1538125 RepID=A0AAV4RFM9_9ARAC|nr:hypothetical protein CDAR_455181 [Caerostris darwini]
MRSVNMCLFGSKMGCLWPYAIFACRKRLPTLKIPELSKNGFKDFFCMSSLLWIVMSDNHPRGSKVFAIVERSVLLVKVPSRDNELTLKEKTSEAGCHRIPKVFTVPSSMLKEAFGRRKSS